MYTFDVFDIITANKVPGSKIDWTMESFIFRRKMKLSSLDSAVVLRELYLTPKSAYVENNIDKNGTLVICQLSNHMPLYMLEKK